MLGVRSGQDRLDDVIIIASLFRLAGIVRLLVAGAFGDLVAIIGRGLIVRRLIVGRRFRRLHPAQA